MLRTLGITFNKEEEDNLYSHFELNKDGLLHLKELNPIIVDILMGHVFFHTAKTDRSLRDVLYC